MWHLGDLLEKVHTFESLGIRDYRLLWLSQVTTAMGQWMDQMIIQTITATEVRGRVLGVYLLNRGLMPLGSIIAGTLANYLGGPWAVTIMGISCFLLAIVIPLFSTDLWKSKLIPDSGIKSD